MMTSYGQVPVEEDAGAGETDGLTIPKRVDSSVGLPLEVDLESSLENMQWQDENLFTWKDPWLVNVLITLFLMVPVLIGAMCATYDMTGRVWTMTIFIIHLSIALWVAKSWIPPETIAARTSFFRRLIVLILDVWVFVFFYGSAINLLVAILFTDVDGTTVLEWSEQKRKFRLIQLGGKFVAALRIFVECTSAATTMYVRRYRHDFVDDPRLPRLCRDGLVWSEGRSASWSANAKRQLRLFLRWFLWILFLSSLGVLIWCLNSLFVHWLIWGAPVQDGALCDPLDTTECCLPFPSFHHMVRDAATVTGWRVNLRSEILPPLKGGVEIDPTFLNQLDGFSTMAPMLFYMDGLKEADKVGNITVRLQGHKDIDKSITPNSITLLLDVEAKELVPHSAEIDYLDGHRPLVLVFPAQPLKHNTHYAVAVVGATDADGMDLPQTPGMDILFAGKLLKGAERLSRYVNIVFPSLTKAAPWVPHSFSNLQLLFDFQTVSAESQLGPVRAVRDATLAVVSNKTGWGDWKDRVRVVRMTEGKCSRPRVKIARTIHAALDVPWFLDGYGPGHRGATLDQEAVRTGIPTTIGSAKFMIHIPCSLRAAAINGVNATDLKAIMEYGHGLFYTREEASDLFLLDMANKNGYIIMAMDWRGMSAFDLPVVVKTLMATPRLFQAVRDNLIQGYANKLALQHFSQNGMLNTSWFEFHAGFSKNRPVPTYQDLPPSSVFYGISQGGILGAGYTALSGPTGLIDRSVLGVPGTPFALIMSRSLDFLDYDHILLLNFYNNRHVRILLCLTQMAWDSAEGSGFLAGPETEKFPRILMQAGLGDSVVPAMAAEALARGLGAAVLPNHPRDIYGIPVEEAATETSDGPYVTLTELVYEKEYDSLPEDDELAKFSHANDVHVCVRRDKPLIAQVEEFINTGRVLDPCIRDGCRRDSADCFKKRHRTRSNHSSS